MANKQPPELKGLITAIRRVPKIANKILKLDFSEAQVSLERVDGETGDMQVCIEPQLIQHAGNISQQARAYGPGDYIARFWPNDVTAPSLDVPFPVKPTLAQKREADKAVTSPQVAEPVDQSTGMARLEKVVGDLATLVAATLQKPEKTEAEEVLQGMVVAQLQRQQKQMEDPLGFIREQIAGAAELVSEVEELRSEMFVGQQNQAVDDDDEPGVFEKTCTKLIENHGANLLEKAGAKLFKLGGSATSETLETAISGG